MALTAEYIIKSSILSCITFFTTFRKLPEKTCCPKINEKFFFLYLHGLRIPNMYSYLVPHLVITPSSLSAWSKSNHVRIATDVEFFWGVFCMGDLRSCTFLLWLCAHLGSTLSYYINHLQVSRQNFNDEQKISLLCCCARSGICPHPCLGGSVAILSIWFQVRISSLLINWCCQANLNTWRLEIRDFCQIYDYEILVKDNTGVKNPEKCSFIDHIITNRPKCFQNSVTLETSLSDFYKMTLTIMKVFYKKQKLTIIT